MISYIKQKTQKKKISYIGHSQAAIAIVNAAALIPEISDSLSLAVTWCPIAGKLTPTATYFNIMTSSPYIWFFELMGKHTIGDWPSSTYNAQFLTAFPWWVEYFGRSAYDFILNDDEVSRIPAYLHKSSGGTAVKTVKHIA